MPKVYSCNVCELVCDTGASLRVHKRVHAENHFQCPHCSHKCSQKSNLTSHVNAVHNRANLPSFNCDQCPKVFTQKRHLETHINQVHLKIKNLKCTHDGCEEVFGYANVLAAHIVRAHTDIRAFKCPAEGCDRTFATQSDLQSHSTTHSGERNYACTVCEKTFPHRSTLVTHMLDHERPTDKLFKCDKCSYQNNRQAKLVAHKQQVHEGLKPHPCVDCGMSFARPEKLRIHVNAVHLGIKLFECSVKDCDYKSAYAQQIAVHNEFGHREDGSRVHRGMELRVLNMIEQHYPLERAFHVDCLSLGTSRHRVLVDASFRVNGFLVLLEVDEDQHRDPYKYTPESELSRMRDASIMVNEPHIWIRFNPSLFRVKGDVREVGLSERVYVLHSFLQNLFDGTGASGSAAKLNELSSVDVIPKTVEIVEVSGECDDDESVGLTTSATDNAMTKIVYCFYDWVEDAETVVPISTSATTFDTFFKTICLC